MGHLRPHIARDTNDVFKMKNTLEKKPTFIDTENSLAAKLGFSGLPVFLYVPPQGNEAILFEMKIPGNIIEKLNWLTGEQNEF